MGPAAAWGHCGVSTWHRQALHPPAQGWERYHPSLPGPDPWAPAGPAEAHRWGLRPAPAREYITPAAPARAHCCWLRSDSPNQTSAPFLPPLLLLPHSPKIRAHVLAPLVLVLPVSARPLPPALPSKAACHSGLPVTAVCWSWFQAPRVSGESSRAAREELPPARSCLTPSPAVP